METRLVPPIVRELATPDAVYVELGVQEGFTFDLVCPLVRQAIAVDCCPGHYDMSKLPSNAQFFACSTDDFWSQWSGKADVFFIDACHEFEHVRRDFEGALSRLNQHGVILLHDTDPLQPLIDNGPCGDAYKIVDYIRQNHPELQIVNLPADSCGLAIVRRNELRSRSES